MATGASAGPTDGPLVIEVTPYWPSAVNSPRDPSDTGVRARVRLKNPRVGGVKGITVIGRFYDFDGKLLHTDEQQADVESKAEIDTNLYWSNPSSLIVDVIETEVIYQDSGRKYSKKSKVRYGRDSINFKGSGY